MAHESTEWTIMVYMAGDNNLSIDMAYALRDIREAAKKQDKKVNLMVYYDGSGLDTPTLYCDFSNFDNPIYEPAYMVKKRYTYKDPDVAEMAKSKNENAATMYSILNFVDWCVNPDKQGKDTDKYALIFSGHGFGFQSVSFLSDETSDYYMTIKKLRVTLRKIHEEIINKPIALVGFDACVMGMLEIAHEIKEHAGAMIASEGSIPNAGWTYSNILGDLASDRDHRDPKDVAKRFVREFIESQREFSVGGVSVDMSAWDLQETKPVVEALDALGEILLLGLVGQGTLYRPLRNALLQAHWESQSYMFEQNVDLKDFVERLLDATCDMAGDERVLVNVDSKPAERRFLDVFRERCAAVCKAVDVAVLASGFSGGVYQFSNGIAVFFPWTYQTYLFSQKSYTGLQFAKDEGAHWNAFLYHFLKDVTLRRQNSIHGKVNPLFGQPEIEVETELDEDCPENNSGDNGMSKIIDNPANKILEDLGKRIIDNPASKIIDNPASKIIDNPASKIIDNPASKIIDNPANKIIDNPASKIIDNPASKIIDNPASKIIDNPANRAVANSEDRLYNYPAHRIVQNSAKRIIANPANRIIANPANRMLSSSEGVLSSFKNVATPWDIYGYSKEEEKAAVATPAAK